MRNVITFPVYWAQNTNSYSQAYGKYYAKPNYPETLDLRGLIERVAFDQSVYSRDIIEGVIKKLTTVMVEQLEAAQETLYEEQIKRSAGNNIQESVDRSMMFAGWCDAVGSWRQKHGQEAADDKPEFTFRQAVSMAQEFYRQGQEDGHNGTSEHDRLWKLNRGGDHEQQ